MIRKVGHAILIRKNRYTKDEKLVLMADGAIIDKEERIRPKKQRREERRANARKLMLSGERRLSENLY